MTYYDRLEPFMIGIDFDGTITSDPFGKEKFPKPQKGFVKFYDFICEHNIQEPENPIYLVIHTARNLNDDDNWSYVKDYLSQYQFDEIYLPKRDGITMKNNIDERLSFPMSFSANSKLPCSLFIDDLNVCTPKLNNGDLDWDEIIKFVKIELKKLKSFWEDKE